MAEVSVKWTGNSADAQRAIDALERKYDALEQRIIRGAEKQKAANRQAFDSSPLDAFNSKLGMAVTRFAGMAGAAFGFQKIFSAIQNQATEFNNTISELWKKQGAEELKLRVQGGFTPAEVAQQIPEIRRQNLMTPVMTSAEAIMTQKELAGAGFTQADVQSGQAFGAMSQLQAVTNQYGREMGSAKETVLPMSQLLKGLGNAQPSAKDILRVGGKVAALMAESDIQFSDLSQLSQEASTLKQYGVGESEQLAAFSWMADIMGSESAGTGLRLFTSRTATMATDKANVKSLKKIGLKPEDIAIAPGGVTFDQAVDRMRDATKDLPAEEKNVLFKTLYGEKGQNAAAVLLSDNGISTIRRRRAIADNAQNEFTAKLDAYESSRQAVLARNEREKEWTAREEAAKGLTWDEWSTIKNNQMLKLRANQTGPVARTAVGVVGAVGEATVNTAAIAFCSSSGL